MDGDGVDVDAPCLFRLFYGMAFLLLSILWLVASMQAGQDFFLRIRAAPVLIRPSWLPPRLFVSLYRYEPIWRIACYMPPPLMALAALSPESQTLRLCVAASFTAYCLIESGATHSHRDYAIMYGTWAAMISPGVDEHAQQQFHAIVFGIALHYFFSAGLSKAWVGGPLEWCRPGTLRKILRVYYDSPHGYKPLIPAMNRLVRSSSLVCCVMGLTTMVFELILIPLSLFTPHSYRWPLGVLAIGFHVGIGVIQSGLIGAAFLPNVTVYLVAFGIPPVWMLLGEEGTESAAVASDVLSGLWWVSLGIVLVLSVLPFLSGHHLPEDWPITPFALFPYNESQWKSLYSRLGGESDRRLVITTPDVDEERLKGLILTGPCVGESVICDGWEMVIGDTLVFWEILAAFSVDDWNPKSFATAVQQWLVKSRRLVAASSGMVLTRSYYVEVQLIGKSIRITRVLASGGL